MTLIKGAGTTGVVEGLMVDDKNANGSDLSLDVMRLAGGVHRIAGYVPRLAGEGPTSSVMAPAGHSAKTTL